MTRRETIGAVMLFGPILGVFAATVIAAGFWAALGIWAASIAMTACISVGAHLFAGTVSPPSEGAPSEGGKETDHA